MVPRQPTLIGHDREAGAVDEALADAARGNGGLVALAGPPGIGKTTLARAAANGALAAGLSVAWGSAGTVGRAPRLWPVRRVLRAVGRDDIAYQVDRRLAADATAASRFRMFAELSDTLMDVASPAGGLLVVLEDLHRADADTLDLLVHLGGEIGRSRLLVLATVCDPASAVLAKLLRIPGARLLRPPAWNASEVRRYLNGVLNTAAPDGLADEVYRCTGGTPLYVAVAARLLAARPAAELTGTDVRRVLSEHAEPGALVRPLLDSVSDPCQRLLRATVAFGGNAPPELLAGMLDVDLEEIGRLSAEAQHVGLFATASSAAAPSFAADLLRIGVEQVTEPTERRHWNARAAIELAAAEYRAGRLQMALGHCADAARDTEEPATMAAAALVVQGVDIPAANETLAGLADRALAALPDDAWATRARLAAQKACAAAALGDRATAVSFSAQAVDLADRAGDDDVWLEVLRGRQRAMVAVDTAADTVEERRELGAQSIALAGPSRPLAALWGRTWRADAAVQRGDALDLETELGELDTAAGPVRTRLPAWHRDRLRAAAAALTGDFVAARRHAEAVRARAGQDPSLTLMHMSFQLFLGYLRGDPDELTSPWRQLRPAASRVPVAAVSLGLGCALTGDPDGAWEYYGWARSLLRRDPRWLPTLGGLAELAVLHGDVEYCAELRGLLEPYGSLFLASPSGTLVCIGSVPSTLGTLAHAQGDLDGANHWFAQAEVVERRALARPMLVRTRLAWARTLVDRAGRDDAATAARLADKAAAAARELDMPGPLADARRLLDALQAPPNPLTSREHEIADLVASGMSNRTVAERLVLSERTVESHVRNALAKIGAATRTELATWVIRQRRG